MPAGGRLTQLTQQAFQELCTDVCTEIDRRQNSRVNEGPSRHSLSRVILLNSDGTVPAALIRDDFRPIRNEACQTLAVLGLSRFVGLCSNVYFELARRYPEFQEDVRSLSTFTAPCYWFAASNLHFLFDFLSLVE